MMFESCSNTVATHVEILEENELDLLVGKVYQILKDDQLSHEWGDMIEAEDGVCICSFPLLVDVKWLKIKG